MTDAPDFLEKDRANRIPITGALMVATLMNTLDSTIDEADATWAALSAAGIDAADVFATLETRGVASFIDSWEALRSTVAAAAGVSA